MLRHTFRSLNTNSVRRSIALLRPRKKVKKMTRSRKAVCEALERRNLLASDIFGSGVFDVQSDYGIYGPASNVVNANRQLTITDLFDDLEGGGV